MEGDMDSMRLPRLLISNKKKSRGFKSPKFDLSANIHHNRMENKDSAPKDVSKSAGEHLDKPTEDTKSFMTSVGEQFDKTAESVTTFVKGAIPCSSDTGKDSGVSTAPEEKKTEARKA